jgi:drug/metabolite transporter (DMT)-like permease
MALASVFLGASAQLLLKAGVGPAAAGRGAAAVFTTVIRSPQALGGVLLFGVSSAIWLVVLSRLKLSVAYPLGALSYVVVVGAGALLGEHVPGLRWTGVALVALGVALVGGGDLVRDRTAGGGQGRVDPPDGAGP